MPKVEMGSVEYSGYDTKLLFHRVQAGNDIQIVLENIPDKDENHKFVTRWDAIRKVDKVLIDGDLRFSMDDDTRTRLSAVDVWWNKKKVDLHNFPTNQIYNFSFASSYGAWQTYNPPPVEGTTLRWTHGVFVTPNRDGTAVLVNLAEDTQMGFAFSAILIRLTGEWQIFPASYFTYWPHANQKITVVETGGAARPETDRKVIYEDEQNKRKIKLVLGVASDSDQNHKIERSKADGGETVLIDGAPRWYDPASPIKWKLSKVQAWWDGKPINLKNFPENHFFNFSLKKYNLMEVMYPRDKNEEENGIGIYPSMDGSAVYIGMVRRDANSGAVSFATLIIQENGNCEVFPPDFNTFHDDKGQHAKILEGYSKEALKRPALPAASAAPAIPR